MRAALADQLLIDRITVRKPVQSFVGISRRPVFEYQSIATGVKARFNPASSSLTRNVLGQTPKQSFKLFLNPMDLQENYEVIRESDGAVFLVTEVKVFFTHHLEVVVEEKK